MLDELRGRNLAHVGCTIGLTLGLILGLVAALIIVGLLVGGWLGGGWAQHISGPALRKGFAVLMAAAAVKMFFQK